MTAAKTGWVNDPVFLKHRKLGHPERPERFRAIEDALDRSGLREALIPVPARPAGEEEIRLVHHPGYIGMVKRTCERGGGQLDPDTYVNRYSYDAAIRGTGGLIDLSGAIWMDEIQNGYAFVRPPGHHAMPDRAMGFCLFNHVAIAAEALLQKRGADRIAIVDADVHHGNGTQAVFESNASVLYASTHQSPHYPGTGRKEETGAHGTVLNIPLPSGAGDRAVLSCYESLVLPKLSAFRPQMIFVSAGYDTHWRDPLAGLQLSCAAQARVADMLCRAASEMCSGKIVFTLEGGYDPEVLLHGVLNTLRALQGREDFSDPVGTSPVDPPVDQRLIDDLRVLHGLKRSEKETSDALRTDA